MEPNENQAKPVPLSEVKNILKKISKERKELIYEQKIALEHAQKFARLPQKKIEEMIDELQKLGKLQEIHIYKIVDLLPQTDDDAKTIFAKERVNINDSEIKKILEIVKKYSVE